MRRSNCSMRRTRESISAWDCGSGPGGCGGGGGVFAVSGGGCPTRRGMLERVWLTALGDVGGAWEKRYAR